MASFQLCGLTYDKFAPLFELPDDQLQERGILRRVATSRPGFPCRVSLVDAEVGEELLLLPYEHQPVNSPYRASGPIYVRRGAQQVDLPPGEVPPYVTARLISLRAYDEAGLIIDADVCEGEVVAARLERFFVRAEVAYVHLHNAKRGCFSCLARRV